MSLSAPGRGDGAPDPERVARLTAAVRRSRVGLTFWGTAPERPEPGTWVVCADDPETGRRLLEQVPAGVPTLLCEGDGIDPWALLGPGVILLAKEDNPWRVIAAIAGAEVPGPAVDVGRALLNDVAYRDPFTGEATTAEATIALLGEWRRIIDANRTIAACAGMAWWKKARIGQFLWAGRAAPPPFVETGDRGVALAEAADGTLAVWPSRVTPALLAGAHARSVPIVRIEDGFVRSVGLGADLLPPFSIVVDQGGIYYDPDSGSDLERLIETADISDTLRARAEALAATIVERGISKYGSTAPGPAPAPRTRRTVLVAGQVEDDLSVRTGGGGVAGNLGLLRRARAAEPDAHILFKPHPDVDAGHRVGRIADADALALADEVVRDQPIQTLLARVNAVHVLTSLVGFEALMRGLETHVHGRPFYAGWGLTRDHGPAMPQRTARRTLADLVACTLILYPRYLDPVTLLPCPPEILLGRFAAGWAPKPSLIVTARRWQGRLFKLLGRSTS